MDVLQINEAMDEDDLIYGVGLGRSLKVVIRKMEGRAYFY